MTDEPSGRTRNASLTPGADYDVIGVEGDWLRLVNDEGEPVLYDPACFQIVDATEPPDWVSVIEDGVRYAYPPNLGQPGFFEDWHDGVSEVRCRLTEELARRASHPSNGN